MHWPMLLDMTDMECNHALRSMELTVYAGVMSVFRAHGQLSSERRRILSELASMWTISADRHRAEARRVANDEKLNTIAHRLFGVGDSSRHDWVMEGRLSVPPLQRAPPLTEYSRVADTVCRRQRRLVAKLVPPSRTATYRPDLENKTPMPESPIVQWASANTPQPTNPPRSSASPPPSSQSPVPPTAFTTDISSDDLLRGADVAPSAGEVCGANVSITSDGSSPVIQKSQLSSRKRRRSSPDCSLFESTTTAERAGSDTSSTCLIRYSSPTPSSVRATPHSKRSTTRGVSSTHSARPHQLQSSPPSPSSSPLSSPQSASNTASSQAVCSATTGVIRQSTSAPSLGISHSRRVVRPNQRAGLQLSDRANQQSLTATVDPNTESYRQLAGGNFSDLRPKSTVRLPAPVVSAVKRPIPAVSSRTPAKSSQLVVSPASSVRIVSHSPSSYSSATESHSAITIAPSSSGTSANTVGTFSTNTSSGHRVASMVVLPTAPSSSLPTQPTPHRPIKMVAVNQHSSKMASVGQQSNKIVSVGQQSNKVAVVSQRPNKMATVAVAPLVSAAPSTGRVISVGRSTVTSVIPSSSPSSSLSSPAPILSKITSAANSASHVISAGTSLTSRRTYSRRVLNDVTFPPSTISTPPSSVLPQLRRGPLTDTGTNQRPSVIYLQRASVGPRAASGVSVGPRAAPGTAGGLQQQVVRYVRPPVRAVAAVRAAAPARVAVQAVPVVAGSGSSGNPVSVSEAASRVAPVSAENESGGAFGSCLSLSDILQATGITPGTDWSVDSHLLSDSQTDAPVLPSISSDCGNSTDDNTAQSHVTVTSSKTEAVSCRPSLDQPGDPHGTDTVPTSTVSQSVSPPITERESNSPVSHPAELLDAETASTNTVIFH